VEGDRLYDKETTLVHPGKTGNDKKENGVNPGFRRCRKNAIHRLQINPREDNLQKKTENLDL